MRRASKGYTGVDILQFPTMLVQGPILQGEGSTVPVESHPTPSGDPTISQPPLSSPSRVPTPPYDLPLPRGHTPGSDEGRMQQNELMDLVTKLSDGVLALKTNLQQTKKVYSTTVTKLIMKVKRLEKIIKSSKARRRAKIVVSDDEDVSKDSSKQWRIIEDIDHDAGITLVTPTKASTQEDQPEDQLGVLSATKVLTDAARVHTYSRRRAISTGSSKVSTASRIISTAKEIVSTAGASMPVSTAGIVQESTSSPKASKDKGKAIITKSEPERTTTKLKERQERAGYEATIRLQEHLDEEESQRIENIKARVEADEELTQKLQAEEKDKYSEVDQAKILVKEIFETTMRRVHSFVPMDSELEVQRLKRAGQEVLEEPIKRQKIREASGSGEEQSAEKEKEVSEEELQKLLVIVPVEEVYIESLQRFEDMLKRFDRDDLEKLWDLVKKRFSSTEPTVDKEKELWSLVSAICNVRSLITDEAKGFFSPLHDDPYMEVMQAYDATNNELHIPPLQAPITPPTIVSPSLVLSLSPMFDSRDFFPPEEISPPKDIETPVESPILIYPSLSVGSSSPVRSTTPSPDYPFDKYIFAELDNSLWIIPRPLGSEPVLEEPNESDACESIHL
ncbi:hypothetical protein Tco_0682856 [Tanacetum coccineum]|uniref:Uncharacterized protein n=1 Tax=Tanacetum coccineum TaxID=301880 RepID=A0ABQ4XT00_9ASTR